MPIPKPKGSETEEEYVSRCIGEIYDEYGQEQGAAICYNTYRTETKMSGERLVASKINQISKYRGIYLGENSSACWENYIQVGTKILDGKEVPDCRGPIEEAEMIKLAEYPWEQCIIEQTDKYGSKDIAEKVCGYIKSTYGS